MQMKATAYRNPGEPTYDSTWAGVTYLPDRNRARCTNCNGHLHHEEGARYCPRCDDPYRESHSHYARG